MDLDINAFNSIFWITCQNLINTVFRLILSMIRGRFGSQLVFKDLDSDNHESVDDSPVIPDCFETSENGDQEI
jgi:hypothetical protein